LLNPFCSQLQPIALLKGLKAVFSTPDKFSQMKFKHYLLVFLASFGMSLFFASCLNDDNKIPPNCYDLILNNGEEGIDCGGPCDKECDHCINGIFEPQKGETWKDCGGPCAVCPQCANGIKDGDEVGIDCGGSCGGCELLCNDDLLNGFENEIDCQYAIQGIEIACELCPTCTDDVMNGTEVGIDCGGPTCPQCCISGNCRNGIRDGNEFWNDCGGSNCPNCPDTLSFRVVTTNTAVFVPSSFFTVDYSAAPVIDVVTSGAASNGGDIFVRFSEYPTPNQEYQLATVASNIATLSYTDEAGIVYSSAYGGASGKVTYVKKAFLEITAGQNCSKPSGAYRYWRATFSNVILFNIDGTLQVQLTDGLIQKTIFN
jgi:hypothetical protein